MLHSTPEQHIDNTNGETIITRSFTREETPWARRDSGSKHQTSEIAFNVSSNGTPGDSTVYTTNTTSHVIRTYQPGEPFQFTIKTEPVVTTTVSVENNSNQDSKNTNGTVETFHVGRRGSKVSQRENISLPPTFSQMESVRYTPVDYDPQDTKANTGQDQEDGIYSTQVSKTTRKSRTSYTYKIQDGVAILENVTRHPTQSNTTTISQTQENSDEVENQKQFPRQEFLLTNEKPTQTTRVKAMTITQQTPQQGSPAVHFQNRTTSIAKEQLVDNTELYSSSEKETNPEKQLTADSLKIHQRQFKQPGKTPEVKNQYTFTIQAVAPSKMQNTNSDNQITQTTAHEDLPSQRPGPNNKFATQKLTFLKRQDPKPDINLRISAPTKHLIQEFTKQRSSVQIQQLYQPTKEEKRNVAKTNEHTTAERNLTADKTPKTQNQSTAKVYFLQTTEKPTLATMNDGPPRRLLIPDLNRKSNCVNASEVSSPPKVQKCKAEQWITQKTKDQLQSEPPSPTNKLSTDKLQFLQHEEIERVEKVHVSSPGKLVIPDFNQQSTSREEQHVSPPPKVEKRNAEQWITQTIKQEELRSQKPPPTNKLSTDKLQFLQHEEIERVEKVHVSSPGKLVIPDFNQQSTSREEQHVSPPPKVDKRNAEQWITQTIKQEELRSEPPPPTNKLSTDKLQFLQHEEIERVEKVHVSSPGKLVIPDFNQQSTSIEEQHVSPPPKVDKRNAEQWITQTIKQEEIRSEPPPPTNKLSTDKLQFLQHEDIERVEKVHVSSPGKLVIPDFNQQSTSKEEKHVSPPPKVDKRNAEQWITQTIKQEELRSEPPPPTNKLSTDKLQFLQHEEIERVEKVHVSSPGKLVIPDFNQQRTSKEEQHVSPPPKVEKRNAEQWITQTIKQEELRSEPPPPTNKLSTDKLQFLQHEEIERVEKVHVSSPGKLVIPDFNQQSTSTEEQHVSPPPKVDKRNAEQWITQTIKQEEIRAEPPPPTNKLSTDKLQFLQHEDIERVEKVHVSSPGKLVIPDFNQQSTSKEEKHVSPPPKVDKRNAEQWITQTIKQEELRSEPPPPTNKLSTDKLQFLQHEEIERVEKVLVSSPGKLVIPDFNQQSTSREEQHVSPHPKVEKRNAEQWITQTIKQEELRSEPPPPTNKLSTDKLQFLQHEEIERVEKVHVSSPGKLVIPDFNQQSTSREEQHVSPPPKVDKRNAEQWITQTIKQEELRSEPPPPTNKLSTDKLQFLQHEEIERVEKVHVSSPGKLVIPDFNQQSTSIEKEHVSPPPKVEKRNAEKWITQTIKQEELRSEPPPPTNKLSTDKLQFLQHEEIERVEKVHVSSPGELLIPDFNQQRTSREEQHVSPPPKVEKRNAEQWITQTIKQEELRSEPPPPTNKLSTDKLQFLQHEEIERVEKVLVSSPGKLVIPDFNQQSTSREEQHVSPPPKVEKRNAEQWITQTIKQEELRSEPPPPTNKLSTDKLQFLQHEEIERVEKVHVSSPGKLVIPDFNQQSTSREEQHVSPPPKVDKRNAEQWITQTIKQEELRSEPPPPTNKLSTDKLQFLQHEEIERVEKVHVSSPGKLVIPDFNQQSTSIEEQHVSLPPKVEKRNAEQWITQTIKQEELRSEPPPPTNKLSTDKLQFLQNEEIERVEKVHVSSPGKLVIPDFNQQSTSKEEQHVSPPPKVEKRNAEQWITQTIKQEELRSEPPPPTNKLSTDKLQFLQHEEIERVEKVHVSSPGKLVIPDFNQQSTSKEEQHVSPPPKVDKRNAEQWITQTIKQEELRSEPPPPTNKLSTDKLQFLQHEEIERVEKVHVSSPGKLVIPDFNQQSTSIEEQHVSPPPKVDKRNAEQWITQTIKQEELRSEPPPPTNKLSTDKLQFLQQEEIERVEKVHVSSPGKLVIPDFNQQSNSIEEQHVSPPPKVEKRNAEQWITQTIKQEELRSEPPPPTNKLSTDKLQFLQHEEIERVEKVHVSSPGKLVIPDFNQQSTSREEQHVSPPPKVEKRNAEQWITQTIKQEELRSEPPPPTNKLSTDKLQFLQQEEIERVEKVLDSSPGKLVIPDFNQQSTSREEHVSPPPKVDKRNAEQWITQTIKQEELRSEPPPPTNKLSTDKLQFLQHEEIERVEKVHVSSPGKLVIADFNQQRTSREEQHVSPPPKVEKRNAEQWITQTIKQEELRSEPPPPTNKLSTDKLQFLQHEEIERVEKVHVSSPGKLVIPDFNQQRTSKEEQHVSPHPKVEKRNAEQWITQTIKQEELRSEPPPPTNKLSTDKLQFLQHEEIERVEKVHVSSPGKLVIPDFNQQRTSIEEEHVSPPPKVEKRNAEQWITQTIKQEELRSQPPPPTNKLSTDKLQFLQHEEIERVEKVHVSSPGKLVIPDFNQQSTSIEEQHVSLPPKVEKRNAEQWITQTIKQEELRSEPPPPTNKLSTDKLQFLQHEEIERVEKVHVSSPGKLVIPNFNQQSTSIEEQHVSPPPKVEKRNAEQWITQTIKQEELRSEPPPPTNKLSTDKLQFLRQEEIGRVEKVHVSSPGKLVIPDLNQQSTSIEEEHVSPPPKVDKRNAEQWITQTIKQEELRSELPPPTNKLSTDKLQFLQHEEIERVEKVHVSSPGKLVIPDFNQQSTSKEEEHVSPSPKVEKRNAEQWITQTIKQEELRSEPPPPTNKLSTDKLQFLQHEEIERVEKVHVSSPGKLVIPDFNQQRTSKEEQHVSPHPKVEKRNAEQWITQTIKQEELRSEPPPPTNKLSTDKLQFLQHEEIERVEKVHVSSPGNLVIPDFNQQRTSIEEEHVSPPPKVEKRNAEQWITQTIKQEELRSQPPPPTNKLSTDKLQFLQHEEIERVEKVHVSSPGKLVIPDFNQQSTSIEEQHVSLPPKVEKRNAEQWITQTIKQEELRSEPPPPTNKLSTDKLQFLQQEEIERVEKVHVLSPGKLVIPDFNQQSTSREEQHVSPPLKVEKRNAEQWITQTIKQEEHRSEPPPPTNKLSTDKLQFLQHEEIERVEKVLVSSPGKLVIPDFVRQSTSREEQHVLPPPKVEKRNAEQWITQTIKQEELRSESPSPTNKLSTDKLQFLEQEEIGRIEKVHVSSPGKLVIPDFNQQSTSREEQHVSPPPKVDKRNTEQWITQTIKQEELRSEPPPPTNKLSTDKLQFLQHEEIERVEKVHVSSPGKLVIPDFNQQRTSREEQHVSPPPKVEKRNAEQWITQTIKQEELRSEPPPPTNKLSTDKLQFLQQEEIERVEKVHVLSPGKLVIPDFNQQSTSREEQHVSPPPKVEKRNAEQWITQTIKQEELRSEPPPPTNKLSTDKLQFLQHEEIERVEKVHVSSPGKLVIPDFNRQSSSREEQHVLPPPKVEKRNAEQWITQTIKQEELRSESPSPTNKLSTDKLQFLEQEEIERVEKVHVSSPGKLVIPDFNQQSTSREEQHVSPPPKVDKRNTEQWITQTIKQEELRSEPPPPTNKLSTDKLQFLHQEEIERVEKVHVSSPGKLVILDFKQQSTSREEQHVSPPPKVDKRNAEQWITQTIKQEELRSEPPPPTNKLSTDKLQFLQHEDIERVEKVHVSSPGKLVIPDFNQQSISREEQHVSPPSKLEKRNPEKWITQTVKQEELRSEPPPPTNKLSTDKLQFLQHEEIERVEKVHVSSPGKLVIPDFNQQSTSREEHVSPPPKAEKRNAGQWITQIIKEEELRSEPPPPTNKLSTDKLQFLQHEEIERVEKVHVSSPGKLVIPDFNQQSTFREEQHVLPPSKVEKRNAEQWIMQTVKEEDVLSGRPPPLSHSTVSNKRSTDKVQFSQTHGSQTEAQVDGFPPGRLVIRDFQGHTSSVEVQEVTWRGQFEKGNAEQGVTKPSVRDELRSEPPPPGRKLSTEKVQFLQKQDAQQGEKIVSSPGKIVIPDCNQHSSSIEVKEVLPQRKVERWNPKQWITQTTTQDEIRSELPTQTKKLSRDKALFLQTKDKQPATKINGSSPGRLVIPDFTHKSSSIKVQEVLPTNVDKRSHEQWVTQTIKEETVRSEVPLPTEKLPSEKLQFLQSQETNGIKQVAVLSPGRLIIPDFNQRKSTADVQSVSTPQKVKKRNADEWITHSMTREEVRSLPIPSTNKLSEDKVQFLQKEQIRPLENESLPSRLVIPDFNQKSSSVQAQDVTRPPRVEKRNPKQWITQISTEEDLRSEMPPPSNKLSRDKLEFVRTQETRPHRMSNGSPPGRIVIPDFGPHSFSIDVQKVSPPPKVNRINAGQWMTPSTTHEELRSELPPLITKKVQKRDEQWMTQSIEQEELRSELPPPTNKLSADIKLQFVHAQDVQPSRISHGSKPGRLVIPDYGTHSFSIDVQKVSPFAQVERSNAEQWTAETTTHEEPRSPPSKLEKRKTEHWITQSTEQEELRSQLSHPANKFSADKLQFVQTENTEQSRISHGSTKPGKLVIPDYGATSFSIDVQEVTAPQRAEKRNAEQWRTQTTTPEELKSELPPAKNKLSAAKMKFVNTQDTTPARISHGSTMPGRLTANSFSIDVQKVTGPQRTEKHNAEQWRTQTTTPEELRSDLLPTTNKLSAAKMRFVNTQDTQPPITSHRSTMPERLVIPDYGANSFSIDVQGVPAPQRTERRNEEQWRTQTATHKELLPATNNLSASKLTFVNAQDTQHARSSHGTMPGRLVIRDFSQHSSSFQVNEVSPLAQKVKKSNSDKWITHSMTHEEIRSLPLPSRNKLSADKVQTLQKQEAQRGEKLDGSSTGALSQSFTLEVQEVPRPFNVEKCNSLKWVTKTNIDDEIRTEIPSPRPKLSADEVQKQGDEKVDGSIPGKWVIPVSNKHNFSVEVEEVPSTTEERNSVRSATETNTHGELRAEMQSPRTVTVRNSKFVHHDNQNAQPTTMSHGSTPRRLVIHHPSSSLQVTTEPKEEKHRSQQWKIHSVKHEGFQSLPLSPTTKPSTDTVQFVQNQESRRAEEGAMDSSSLSRLVIPDTGPLSFSIDVEGYKDDKWNAQTWTAQKITYTDDELSS